MKLSSRLNTAGRPLHIRKLRGEKMSKMPLHEEGIPLQEWANAREPGDNMLWKSGYWEQILFVRDVLPQLFFESYEEYKNHPIMVVGTHVSKSISLPVFSIKKDDLEVRMRYNFFDWKVSVRSAIPVPDVFSRRIKRDQKIHRVYFEGFQDDWIFGSYNEDPRQFSVKINSEHDVYAFLLAITEALFQKKA